MAKILIGQLGSAISPKIILFVRPATKKDFIEARNAYASGWKFQQEYVESLLRGCKPVYRLPFDPSGGDCVPLVAEGNWVAILVDEELNLSGIVAFGETLDAVKELIEDFEEPIEIC